jgi:LuxR family maltose regulon positive regulatory protein
MKNAIIATKLFIPPLRSGLVSRQRLIERLNAGMECKLTLISAPAGFGKTTLLSEWVAQIRCPVAWVSLDNGDNNLSYFLTHLLTALQRINVCVSKSVHSILQFTEIPHFGTLSTWLINEIAETPETFTLVLDDYHEIIDRQIHELISLILDGQPLQMHIIISSRADPPWSLAQLRGRREVSEIRADDLRFTIEETATLLSNIMGFHLAPEDIATLERRTEGWITGLQMAALSMRGREDVSSFIKTFSGTHRFILDYLVDEVIDQQHSDVQEFLLRTSILERMSAPLCNAVTGNDNSQTTLTQLEQNNLFLIPLDDERRWFRYHHLFTDLLRVRLGQTQSEQISILHRRASEWYERNELIAEAVSHAWEANEFERVVNLLAGNALAMIYQGELRTLIPWLEALSHKALCSQPWLNIARAWTLSYAGKFDAIESLLKKTETTFVRLDGLVEEPLLSEVEFQSLIGHIATIRAYTAAIRGENSYAVEQAYEALQNLPAGNSMVRGYIMTLLGAALRSSGDLIAADKATSDAIAISQAAGDCSLAAIVLCDLAALQYTKGQLHEAAATCQEVQQISAQYARQSGRSLPVMGYAHMRLSAVLREWNNLENASRYAKEGLELCMQWGQADFLVYSYIELAKILLATGDMDDAFDAIQMGKRVVKAISPWPRFYLEVEQVQLWLALGNILDVSSWVQDSGLSSEDKLSFQYLFRYINLARVFIALRRFNEAAKLVERLLEVVEVTGATGYVIEILTLQAITLQAQGEIDRALNSLARALALAEPEGYVRTFIDEGIPMGVLLRQAISHGIAVRYAGKLLAVLEKETSGKSVCRMLSVKSIAEPLSERELQVLRLLNTYLSSKEIAAELFISVNTIRSHIKNIYSKLNVHSRKDAVTRAREIELL